MKHGRKLIGSAALVCLSVAAGRFGGQFAAMAQPGRGGDGVAATDGPDVIVGALPAFGKYGSVDGIAAYSIATTSCNIGDEILLWCDTNVSGLCADDEHPVIAQNLYRLKDGRFEMIGMSWLKHGFCALAQTLCGPCTFDPFGCNALGLGCSDPYSASLNGQQSNLGPRSQVNASTGIFPYPFSAPAAPVTIGRRLQVASTDLDPARNSGALYFGEGHYVTADDAAAGNDANNASYRRATVGSFTSGAWTLAFTGATIQQQPAIFAWKANGLGAGVPDPNVTITPVDLVEDGRFLLGYKVSDNENGTWHYEFALHNLSSHRSGQSFSVPVPAGVELTNVGQRMVNHHSGEPYSADAWTFSNEDGLATWQTQTFAENTNANALRWGTLFNFRFDANSPPSEVLATLGLFRSGTAENPGITTFGPSSLCAAADLNCDGSVDGEDLGLLLASWGTTGPGDLNGDGIVDGSDLGELLAAWS